MTADPVTAAAQVLAKHDPTYTPGQGWSCPACDWTHPSDDDAAVTGHYAAALVAAGLLPTAPADDDEALVVDKDGWTPAGIAAWETWRTTSQMVGSKRWTAIAVAARDAR